MTKFYCKVCEEELEGKRRKFCSINCNIKFQSQNRTVSNKNPFSLYGTNFKEKRKAKAKKRQNGLGDPTWMGGSFISNIPDNVRYLVASIPDEPYMQEDMQEIDKIIIEELSPARAKRVRNRRSPKLAKEHRRQKAKGSIAWEKGLKFDYKKKEYVNG